MGDLRIECRFKNAVLFNAMVEVCQKLAIEHLKESNGRGPLPLIRATSEHTGVSRGAISHLLNLRKSPWDARSGEPSEIALQLADQLGKPFHELFPRSLYLLNAPSVIVKEVDSEEVLSLQEAAKQRLLPSYDGVGDSKDDLRSAVDGALTNLKPRYEQVIRMRFGLDGEEKTLEETAIALGVTRERIRQIELGALRKLRHPSRSAPLREYA